jgi:quercetin dioxygenase-like cupin family protein
MADSVVRTRGQGRAFWMLGGLYEVRVSSDESGGAVTTMEMLLPPGAGPPPHTHPGAETVYVLEGTITYHIGDEDFEGTPGSIFHIPAGTMECFEPTGDTNVRLLVSYMPGGIEQFFAEAGEEAPRMELPPPMTEPPDIATIAAIGAKYGMNIQV